MDTPFLLRTPSSACIIWCASSNRSASSHRSLTPVTLVLLHSWCSSVALRLPSSLRHTVYPSLTSLGYPPRPNPPTRRSVREKVLQN